MTEPGPDRAELRATPADGDRLRVAPDVYRTVFELDPQGRAILEDLVARFHDCPIGSKDEETHRTARELGRRDVVQFVLRRIGQVRNAESD